MVKLKGNLVLKGTLLAAVPLCLACFFAVRLVDWQHQLESASAKQLQLAQCISDACAVLDDFTRAQSLLEAQEINPDSSNLKDQKTCLARAHNDAEKLNQDRVDEPGQSEIWASILASSSSGSSLIGAFGQDQNSDKLHTIALKNSLRGVNSELTSEINALSHLARPEKHHLGNVSPSARDASAAALFFCIIGAVISTYLFCLDLRRKVRLVAKNASEIGRERPPGPRLAESDELWELEETLQAISISFDEMRVKERAIVENVTDVICTVDYAGTITKMNHSVFEMLGFRAEELIGTKFLDLIKESDYEDTVRQLRQMRKFKLKSTIENQALRKDKSAVSVLWSGHWSESERSFYFVAHDITARKRQEEILKQSEAKVRNILESLPLGIIMLNERDEITFVNSFMTNMFESSESELLNRSALSLFVKTPTQAAGESFSHLVSRCSGPGYEWQAIRANEQIFEAELGVQDPSSRRESDLVIAILDVTAEKEVQRMRQDLIGIVSHELRSPLTAIKGFITLLVEGAYGEISSKVTERAKRAESNANRLMKLVNELLLIEKLESGVMAVEQTVTDFSTVLGSALEAVRELAESRQVKVLNQTSNAEIYVDPDRLTQVLINLLSNAIKYSEPGQSVSIQETNTEEWFEIRVSDEGRGIPATAKEKIFQRFQQVELGDSKRKGGTGLGLAICKAIIEQHNGSIGVDSELGRGSTFWFRIPAVGKVIELKPESEKVAMLSERKEI